MKKFFSGLFSIGKPKTERKFYGTSSGGYGSRGYSSPEITPSQSVAYYLNIAPLFTAIDMLTSEITQIDNVIKNQNVDEYVYEHPLLDLLRSPSAVSSGSEFMQMLSAFYLLSGNAFIVATGPVNRPPLELLIINPSTVTLEAGDDGYLEKISVIFSGNVSRTFTRKEVNGKFRYYDGAEAEIWHVKTFNPGVFAGKLWGMSPLNPISIELDQYLEASMHNLSLLKRGARPSGALTFNEMLTDDQFQRYQKQADQFYSGSSNAGRLLLLENASFQEMSQTNKDMDFASLKAAVTNTIYSSFRIPLPLVNAEFSTYDNLATSKLNLYDNAVLPLLDKLLSDLNEFLMPRYANSKGLILSFDPESLAALEPRKVDKVVRLQGAGVLTLNELRTILGYEHVNGGDEIYINSSMLPLSEGLGNVDLTKSLLEKNNLSY